MSSPLDLLQCHIHGVQQGDCQVHLVPPHVSRTAIGEMVRQSSFTATIVATRLMAGPSPVHVRGRTHILLMAKFILDEVNEPSVLELLGSGLVYKVSPHCMLCSKMT